MKLQIRFLLVIVVIFSVVASFLLLQKRFAIDRSQSVLSSELQQRKSYFQNIVNLAGGAEQTITQDYSFWDDLVTFVQTDDVTFAHENLDTGLVTFNVDADWVYRANGTLLYFSSINGESSVEPLSLPPAFFKQLAASKFIHFYQRVNGNLVEIRGATIVPSDDENHTTPAQGYLLFGRILNKNYTDVLSTITGSTVEVASASDTGNVTNSNSVSFGLPLQDWNGQRVATLRSTSSVLVITDLKQQSDRQLQLLGVFSLLAAAVVIYLLWWFVLRPLNVLDKAIKQQQPALLDRIRSNHTEFGRLAQTVAAFFQQKVSLAEAEFKRTELEKLNKEKASFLAIAAHELNTPVANVKLFSEYLTFLLTKNNDKPAIDKQVHRIQHQSTKINMLLNDLRAAGDGKQKLEFNLRDFDFDTFLKEEVDEASFSTKSKLVLTGETHAQVHSDPDRLGQVVTNLIRNATKYSPKATDILILSELRDGQIVVNVKDFGIGIAPDDVSHLFERFYRSPNVSSSFPGLGLGLYISKNIVESLGGKIWVDSALGNGSTFSFSIPVKKPVAADSREIKV